MSSSLIIGLEMALVFGGVLVLAVFEVIRMRRDRRKPPDSSD